MKDTKQFRERFKRWKEGTPIESIYDHGRPTYSDNMELLAQTMAKNWDNIKGEFKPSAGYVGSAYSNGKDDRTYIGGSDQEVVITPGKSYTNPYTGQYTQATESYAQPIASKDPYVDYQFYSPTGNSIVQTINSAPKWQQYWADQEGGRVSNAMHQAAPKVLDLLMSIDAVARLPELALEIPEIYKAVKYRAQQGLRRISPSYDLYRTIGETTPKISNRFISTDGQGSYDLFDPFGRKIGGASLFKNNREGTKSVGFISKHKKKANKVTEDIYNTAVQDITSAGGKGLESGWDLMSPERTLSVTKKFPHQVIGTSQGHDVRLLTGTTSRPLPRRISGNHYQEIAPEPTVQYNEITGEFEAVPPKTMVEDQLAITWKDAVRTPKITKANAASITPELNTIQELPNGYSLALEDALKDINFDFEVTGTPRTWWDIMLKKKPEIAREKWKQLGLDKNPNQIISDRTSLEGVKNIFNSNWYSNRLSNVSNNSRSIINQFNKNIDNTTMFARDPGLEFGLEADGRTIPRLNFGIGVDGTPTQILKNNVLIHPDALSRNGRFQHYSDEMLDELIKHEGLHASSGVGIQLPKEIKLNNAQYHMTPKEGINANRRQYLDIDDEQRVRLLKFADIAEKKFKGDYEKAYKYLEDNYYTWAANDVPQDVMELLYYFNKPEVIDAAKHVLSVAPLGLGLGAATLSKKKRYVKGKDDNELPEVVVTPTKQDDIRVAQMRNIVPNNRLRKELYDYMNSTGGKMDILPLNDRVDRFIELWNYSNRPKIKDMYKDRYGDWVNMKDDGTSRAYYSPYYNTMYLGDDDKGYTILSELAHAYQRNSKNSVLLKTTVPFEKLMHQVNNDKKDKYGRNGYNRIGNLEYNAHKLIQPSIDEYIFGYNDVSGVDDYLNIYNTPTKQFYEILRDNVQNVLNTTPKSKYPELYDPYSSYARGKDGDGDGDGDILGLKVPYWAETTASFVPILGTAMDIKEAIQNPSWSNIGTAGLSLLSDLSGTALIRGAFKASSYASKIKKAEKTVHKLYKTAGKTEDYSRLIKAQDNLRKLEKEADALGVMDIAPQIFNKFMLSLPIILDASVNADQHGLNPPPQSTGSYAHGKDSGIYIKPSKRGTFTAAAKKRGMSVQGFASKVLNNPSNYSKAMRKKAQFAKNASKFKH